MPAWMTCPGTTRCQIEPSKNGAPGGSALFATVPSARPTKLATVIGARSNSSASAITPLFVCSSA